MKYLQQTLYALALLAALVTTGLPIHALFAAPILPAGFYGEVKIDGTYVPNGTQVSAWINGTLYAQVQTFTSGGASVYTMDVNGDDPDTPGAVEGGANGQTVVFRLNSMDADQTAIWQIGTTNELDLTASQGTTVGVSLPANQVGAVNSPVVLPINVSTDLTARQVLSYQTMIIYDSNVLTYTSYSLTGTLSSGWTVQVNSATPGQLSIAAYGTQPLASSGTLLNLRFTATNTAGAQTDLVFNSFKFNEGTPQVQTSNGRFTTNGLSVAGKVTYAASGNGIAGVTVDLIGPSDASATTPADGIYSLSLSATGHYTAVASKSGDHQGAISGLDSARILEYVTGTTSLSVHQQTVADVSQYDGVTALDASLIARSLIGLIDPPSVTGKWSFSPPSRTYANLTSSQIDQDFTATLYGDVTGNWGSATAASARQSETGGLRVTSGSAQPGETVTVQALMIGNSREIQAFQFDMVYDPAVASLLDVKPSVQLGEAWTILYHEQEPGRFAVIGYSAEPVAGEIGLLDIQFSMTGQSGERTPLTIGTFRFNEGLFGIPQPASSGEIQVEAGNRIFLPLATK